MTPWETSRNNSHRILMVCIQARSPYRKQPRLCQHLWKMTSGTNLSCMIQTPILTLQQSTFGSHTSLWKARYVKKRRWLSSVTQHHAAICRSNLTQNPISHSTVVNRMEGDLSHSFPLSTLPCLSFSGLLTFALNCLQAFFFPPSYPSFLPLVYAPTPLPQIIFFFSSPVSLFFSTSLSLSLKHILIPEANPLPPYSICPSVSVLSPSTSFSYIHTKPDKSENAVYVWKTICIYNILFQCVFVEVPI